MTKVPKVAAHATGSRGAAVAAGAARLLRDPLCLAAILTPLVLVGLVLGAGGWTATGHLAQLATAVAEGTGAVYCALAARHVRSRGRIVWALFACALTSWCLTDVAYEIALLRGVEVPEVSAFDAGWLLFYPPAAVGVATLYARLRPERGWQGLIDGGVLVVALGLFGWTFLLGPVAAEGSGGVLGTGVNLLYPALDLACAVAIGWLVARLGRRAPAWLWLIAAALLLQTAGNTLYLGLRLSGVDSLEPLVPAGYVAAGLLWALAARTRRRRPERVWEPAAHSAPPVWSRALPFVLGCSMFVLLVPGNPAVGAVAMCGTALAVLRVVHTLKINDTLLEERDRLLLVDALTGAHNRRFFELELERAFARAARGGESLALIAFDLDRFKQVNDSLGHVAGDALLAAVARDCRTVLRGGDVLCRLGGDEFAVLAPLAQAREAHALAERLRGQVRAAGLAIAPGAAVSASLGVAAIPELSTGPRDLLHKADEALYVAKAAGGDLAVIYDEAVCASIQRREALRGGVASPQATVRGS